MGTVERTLSYHIDNGEGWALGLMRVIDERAFVPGRRPLLIIPGYGMNSFIFTYHPSGVSMMDSLAAQGFEVWTVDMRTQGSSRRLGGSDRYCIEDMACTDLQVATRAILERTQTGAERVDALGCSLGGTYIFANVACRPDSLIGAIVSMGAPLRWEKIHPLFRTLFGSPWLVGKIPMKGIRPLSAFAFPLIVKVPWLAHIYVHPDHVDVSASDQLVRTVENPNPGFNRELAQWMRDKDLVIRGINVSEAVREARNPLLTVVANSDGIVPEPTVLSAHERFGSTTKDILRVGDDTARFAHADLFISNLADERVFQPVGAWLQAQNQGQGTDSGRPKGGP